jgi:hypothetical protein
MKYAILFIGQSHGTVRSTYRGFFMGQSHMPMDKPEFSDRRRFDRIPVKIPVKLMDIDSSLEFTGQTRDISAQGVGLLTWQPLSPDAKLQIWLTIPNRLEPLQVTGKVVWSQKLNPDRYRVGVQLDKPRFLSMALVLENNHTPARIPL